MIVNLVVILLILFVGVFFFIYGDTPFIRKIYVIIISLILILQSGLRNVAVGSDTYAYYLHFQRVKNYDWNFIWNKISRYYEFGEGKDPGYLVFQKITQYVSNDYQVFLIIIAVLFFSALGAFLYKNSKDLNSIIISYVIYSVLFYSFFSITGHRQTIATALSLFSFEYIKKRKWFPFFILILVASTIHKSVLIFIPFYFLAPIQKNSINILRLSLIILPFLMIFSVQFTTLLVAYGGYEQYGEFEGAGTYTFTLMFLFIALLALFNYKVILNKNPDAKYYYNAFTLAIIFIPLTWVNPSAMRIVQYFSIFMLLLIPLLTNSYIISYKSKPIKLEYFIILALILLYIRSSSNMDYAFFWEEMRLGENYH